jgi:hypothetical protein
MSKITHKYFGESGFQILTEITASDTSFVLITIKLLDPSDNCCYSKTIEEKHLTACCLDLETANWQMATLIAELIRGNNIDSVIQVCKDTRNGVGDDEIEYSKLLLNCINFHVKNLKSCWKNQST